MTLGPNFNMVTQESGMVFVSDSKSFKLCTTDKKQRSEGQWKDTIQKTDIWAMWTEGISFSPAKQITGNGWKINRRDHHYGSIARCRTGSGRIWFLRRGYSRKGLFGNINHYDSSGRKIGESRPGLFGGMNNYDANSHKTGSSCLGILGGINHYDD